MVTEMTVSKGHFELTEVRLLVGLESLFKVWYIIDAVIDDFHDELWYTYNLSN